MTNSIHPFDSLVQHFAELLAQHLNGTPRAAKTHAAPAAAAAPAARAAPRKLRKGEKRPGHLIAQTTEQLHAFIKSHQGQRIEQIAKALGTSTKELKLPAQKLLADKKIKTKGVKRATKYYAA